MKLETARRLARWAQKISVAMADLAKELSSELQDIEAEEAQRALLGIHIFQARPAFREVSGRDRNKSQHKTERELQRSFFRARQLGFFACKDAWDDVMRFGVVEEPVPLHRLNQEEIQGKPI